MTFLQIYNRVIYKLFGNSAPPQGAAAVLYGTNGIIDNCHRRIQQAKNYWFMEYTATIAVTAGTESYALPTDFKEIDRCGFKPYNATTTDYETPLSQMGAGESWSTFKLHTDTADYPTAYSIFGGALFLKPIPSLDITLYLRYYRYLPRLVNDADEDVLCLQGYEAIINFACAEYLEITKENNESQVYLARANDAIEVLRKEDMSNRRAEIKEIDFRGF